jgi:hypothetical protein
MFYAVTVIFQEVCVKATIVLSKKKRSTHAFSAKFECPMLMSKCASSPRSEYENISL